MTDRAEPLSGNRRVFLKAAVAAGSAVAMSGVSAAVPAIEPDPPHVNPDPDAGQSTGGYRETSHIREYYKTLRE